MLLRNRREDYFGIAPFGLGYDQLIYKWIIANYVKIDQLGPRIALLPSGIYLKMYQPYEMDVYEKRNEETTMAGR